MIIEPSSKASNTASLIGTYKPLTRLVRRGGNEAAVSSALNVVRQERDNLPTPDNFVERCVGTVVHLALEMLSRRPLLPHQVADGDCELWRVDLQRQGLWGDALEKGLQQVVSAVARSLLPNGSGRWVLSPEHDEARSEWSLTTIDAVGQIRDIVIDRSFVDRETGQRWVIDYKSSSPLSNESVESFIVRESASYREQLRCYRDALRRLFPEPVRCALFFTSLGRLHTIPELDLPAVET